MCLTCRPFQSLPYRPRPRDHLRHHRPLAPHPPARAILPLWQHHQLLSATQRTGCGAPLGDGVHVLLGGAQVLPQSRLAESLLAFGNWAWEVDEGRPDADVERVLRGEGRAAQPLQKRASIWSVAKLMLNEYKPSRAPTYLLPFHPHQRIRRADPLHDAQALVDGVGEWRVVVVNIRRENVTVEWRFGEEDVRVDLAGFARVRCSQVAG